MARLYVIKTGQTTFEAESRVELAAGVPLSDEGVREVQAAARQLADEQVDAIYTSAGEAERQTAQLVGKVLGVKIRTAENLREIDYGLWQGLTTDEIRRRQPKVYRQWTEAPTTVCPPGGETLVETQQRINQATKEIIKRCKGQAPLFVLRPVALGLLRCSLENTSLETLWEQATTAASWRCYEMSGIAL